MNNFPWLFFKGSAEFIKTPWILVRSIYTLYFECIQKASSKIQIFVLEKTKTSFLVAS